MMNDARTQYRVVVMGKTGTGKSSVCNRLIGRDDNGVFRVYHGMDGSTTEIKDHDVNINGVCLQVVDTPDFFNMGHDIDSASAAFRDWDEAGPLSIPTVILFVVPMDCMVTTEDDRLYNVKFKKIIPFKYRDNMIMGFTKMDSISGSVEQIIPELPILRNLSNTTNGRYVEFKQHISTEELQRTVISMIGTMMNENINERNAIGALVVQYIVRPAKTTAVRLVSFCRRHAFVCTFGTIAVLFMRSNKFFRARLLSAIGRALG